jgi:hydroxypyruvate isomerase
MKASVCIEMIYTEYPFLDRELREAGYQDYAGMEFEPTVPSREAAAHALSLVRGN